MTDQAAPKRPDSCPTCGSENPKIYRTLRPDGQWMYWENGSQYSCSDLWHDTAATTTPQTECPRTEFDTLRDAEVFAGKAARFNFKTLKYNEIIALMASFADSLLTKSCAECGKSADWHYCYV